MKVLAPIALCLWASPAVAQSDTLVLVIDASSSIDPVEMSLQMEGYIFALRQAPYLDNAYIEVILFSDRADVVVSGSYYDAIEYFENYYIPDTIYNRNNHANSITCVDTAFELIYNRFTSYPGFVTIDISGDGAHNCGQPENVSQYTNSLHQNGAYINALVVNTDPRPEVTVFEGAYEFYDQYVVNGFIVEANGFEDFGNTLSRKINLEMVHLMENDYGNLD
jgi:hypothetical protein